MKKINYIIFIYFLTYFNLTAQNFDVVSPSGDIKFNISYEQRLSYSISYHGKTLIGDSPLGFEFIDEAPLQLNLELLDTPQIQSKNDSWVPVVKNKHDSVELVWNEITLKLKEKENECRQIDFTVRVYDDGVAFRYRLYGGRKIGNRQITKELTSYSFPKTSTAWVTEYGGRYSCGQESEFIKTPFSQFQPDLVAGLPFLIEIDKENYVAITEACLNNYPGFFIGNLEQNESSRKTLTTLLSPLPGEAADGAKVRFSEGIDTPWRVIMIGSNPGKFIESEIIHGLNPPCAIKDPSWIKPGMCAWDHWWSGEVKMEMDVIKEYIDLAATQGWPYMLIDWQWYGDHNKPDADITKPAPHLNMPEILEYARSKNVRCWLWLHSSDANKDDSYKEAFALYEKWGIAGVKIDFMSRNDQEMVNWYKRIVEKAAEHKLLVNFHGAYRPDGMDRTYPNQITREGVLGEEYSKFSDRIVPKHNVTLAFTRMLAGAMDYTPGGFLNVAEKNFRQQSPTLVANTRCAELSKFVIYESPLTVVSDHPKNIVGQEGADFLKVVPTVWDDTKFLEGYPDEYIVMAKRNGEQWFIGIMNNSNERNLEIDTSFLPHGKYRLEYWADGKSANEKASEVDKGVTFLLSGKPINIKMACGGGYVGIFTPVF
ncbi:MAG: glycoside hydrolase family 97 protein [Dysgonomonas sp.]